MYNEDIAQIRAEIFVPSTLFSNVLIQVLRQDSDDAAAKFIRDLKSTGLFQIQEKVSPQYQHFAKRMLSEHLDLKRKF